MDEQQDDGMSDLSNLEDEAFPPLPPPPSPGAAQSQDDPFGEAGEGEASKLADVPAAKRKGVKRPQPKLDSQRLISARGLPALRTLFADTRFKGKGHEAENLQLLLHQMENWAHRLFPKLQFEDFIDKVEKLGAKKEVQTCLKRIRLDLPLTDEDFMDQPGSEDLPVGFQDPDPFISRASSTGPPGPVHSTPAPAPAPPSLTEEQRRRMEQNRQRALERRLARQQQTDPSAPQVDPAPSTGSDLTADLNGSAEQDQKPGEHLDPDPSGSTKTPPPEVPEPDPPAELPAEDEKEGSPSSEP